MKTFLIVLLISFTSFIQAQDYSDKLIGTELTYKYSKGNSYHVKFENEGAYYQFLNGSKPEKWWGPFECNVLEKENGEFVVAWYEEGFGDYVTLNINFKDKFLYGSALIITKKRTIRHLQKAIISKTNFK